MDFQLISASQQYKDVIKNLLQFYMYDFSEYTNADVGADGWFGGYPHLESYWKEEHHRFPYIIKQEGNYAGFVLVRAIESGEANYFSIAEFFVLKKYRRNGIGTAAAQQVFNLHKGPWQVYQRASNKPAQLFWNRVINKYTKGQFKERLENGKRIQDFNN